MPASLVFVLISLTTAAAAQDRAGHRPADRAPRFGDYRVATPSKAQVKRPIPPPGTDEETRLRLSDAVSPDDRANFAGGHFVAVWSCGAACVSGAIVEAASGKVTDIPFTVSGWREVHDDFSGISFRHDSRLIVFSGERNERGDMGRHYYVLEQDGLQFLKSVAGDGNFATPPE